MSHPLAELVQIEAGCVFRTRLEPSLHDDAIPVLQLKDVGANARIEGSDLMRIDPATNVDRYRVRTGDVILACRGARFPAAEIMPSAEGAVAISLFHILRVKPGASVHPSYVAWYLNLPETQDYLHQHAAGSGIPFLNRETVGQISIPVPPLDWQLRFIEYYHLLLQERALSEQLAVARRRQMLALARRLTLSNPR